MALKSIRAVGYIRVSDLKQVEEGLSLQVQEQKIRQYATLYNIRLVGVTRDEGGRSSKTLKRPGLQRALRALFQHKAEALIVVKLDRLTRSVSDLGTLLERVFSAGKWTLLAVEEQIDTRTASGVLVLNILMSVSQWERQVIGERTTAAMRYKKSRGEWLGGVVPYGYKVRQGKMTPRPEEQKIIAWAVRLRDSGWTLQSIADEFNEHALLTRSKKPWGPVSVRRILLRAAGAPEEK